MSLHPINDVVVITPVASEETTSSLIIVPNNSKLPKARVVAVGNGYLNANGTYTPLNVQAGDLVILSTKPQTQKFEGQEIAFITERQILAVVK